jgi:hypothetical protein
MSPVTLAELDPVTRQRVLDQIGSGSDASLAIEPQKICGSHQDREARAQRLANLFIGEMILLLVQVRQDFFDKEPNETICGVTTFTDYCTSILRYSEGYIRQLIKGQNPASQKHDGSAHRKPILPSPSEVDSQPTSPEEPVQRPAAEPMSIVSVKLSETASLREWFAAKDLPFAVCPSEKERNGRPRMDHYDLQLFNLTPAEIKAVGELLEPKQ